MNNSATLTVIQETEILGKIIKMYETINNPLFLASDVAEWIEYSSSNGKLKTSQMMKMCDDEEKGIYNVATLGGVQTKWFLTEGGLYEVCIQSRQPIAKQMKTEIKKYLKTIRQTGAAIPFGDEQKMVPNYFSSLSQKTQGIIVNELITKNRELQ